MANLHFKSTRSDSEHLTFAQAVVKGIASDGGLFVPEAMPEINLLDESLMTLSYQELAMRILELFATDFSEAELRHCVTLAYDEKFRNVAIAPIHTCGKASFIELYHGKTLAFKDMALSILPHFMTTSAKKLGTKEKIVILAATSGDTGKAALEGFSDVDGVEIIVFYPTDGVSDVQKRQMITQEGENTHVFGINGNFDDAQNGVKRIFTDENYKAALKEKGYILSSANSINIGRLVPQIVYYISSYYQLAKAQSITLGESINVVVPTGNFGNILAAYYAKQLGLPIKKFICASNHNNVLTDFFNTGVYDLKRDFIPSISPSMDILISSNLERFLYAISDDDSHTIATLMSDLKSKGSYEITNAMKLNMADFYGGFADDKATVDAISSLSSDYGYTIDTHTAVAYQVYRDYVKKTKDETPTLIASTASPFKFPRSVLEGLGESVSAFDDFELVEKLAQVAHIEVPGPIKAIETRPILHKDICDKNDLNQVILKVLG
ncbi:MAG: threonine synthase [Clostridia bacterium]|nr:threonine synthase [Clostridia bacterium]